METAKRSKTFGRSCQVCRLYFLTSDPNTYTCPWCQKGGRSMSNPVVDFGAESTSMNTQILVQEEV